LADSRPVGDTDRSEDEFRRHIGWAVLVGLKGVASVRTAVASAVVAAAVYAAMWLGFRQGWAWLQAADSVCLRVLHDVGVKHPFWVRFWELASVVFSPGSFRLLALGAAVILLSRRRWQAALFALVTVEFSELVSLTAKGLAHRPRPATALVHASSSAFPSGHALCSIIGVLALLTVSAPLTRRSTAVIAVVVGALVVLAVGFARVALNVHHPSDVVAGWALGYLYFALCWAVSGVAGWRLRRRRAAGPEPGSAVSRSACPRSV
jgi:undecaprenyl-diphosphatase